MLISVSCKYLMCKWGMHSCGFMITHCASGPSVLCSPFPWVPGVCGEEWGRACPHRLHLPGSHSYWLPTGSDPGERLVRSKEGGRSPRVFLFLPPPPTPAKWGSISKSSTVSAPRGQALVIPSSYLLSALFLFPCGARRY